MDRPNPRSLTDQQLASFLGNRQDLIRFFRAFIKYLSEAVPDAVDSSAAQIETAQDTADTAVAASAAAQALADVAMKIAQQLAEGPPPLPQPLPEIADDLTHLIHTQQAQIHALTQRVEALEERPTP